VNGDAGVLIRIGSTLCGDSVIFVGRVSGIDVAILENNSGVSKDEVHHPINVAFSIKLLLGVDIEGVLIAFKVAFVEDGEIKTRP